MAREAKDEAIVDFLTAIDTMRVHRSRAGEARKKPLLLLLVLSRIHHRQLTENRIRFPDLESSLAQLIEEFGGRDSNSGAKPEQPFFHLRSSPFWHLRVPEGVPSGSQRTVRVTVLRRPDVHAELNGRLFAALGRDEKARLQVVEALLNRWWEPEEARLLAKRLGFPRARQ